MIGYIYKCTCLINNKVYVGQTRQTFIMRKKDHLKRYNNKNYKSYNYLFYRALRKHGKENFGWEVVKEVVSDDLNTLQKLLNYWEIYYIDLFDSYNNGYNMTRGGDASRKKTKSINVYDKNGHLLDTFSNITDVVHKYKISKSSIWENCGHFCTFVKWNNTRILFRWADEGLLKSDLEKLSKINYQKEICMYSINGDKIKTFSGSKEISEQFNIKQARITANCRRLTSFVQIDNKKYIFKYIDDLITEEDLVKAKCVKSMPKVPVIAIDSITNEIIGEYITQKEAGRLLNVIPHNICEACSGKRKSAGKYNNHPIKWIYKSMK